MKPEVALASSSNENAKTFIDFYQPTYGDSAACSCHTTTSLKLLDDGTVQHVSRALAGTNGLVLILTHKGRRTLRTSQGVVRLDQVYYADGSNCNLASVPAMAQSGVKIALGKQERS